MSENDDILTANDAFYRAFSERDFAAMDSIWSRKAPVVCIHPGWNALPDRGQIMESWRSILDSPEAPRIRSFNPVVNRIGEIAMVICFEALEAGLLVATNIFVQEPTGWKMVHHQASPTAQAPETAPSDPAKTMH